MLHTETTSVSGPLPLKFLKVWTFHDLFQSLVSSVWNSIPTYGCPRLISSHNTPKRYHGSNSSTICYDIIIFFYRGSVTNVKNIPSILNKYDDSSGQRVNYNKSTIIFGKGAIARERILLQISSMRKGIIPFIYLGVSLFKGKPKLCHFWSIVDKIKERLQSWQGRFLSMAGRLVLVKFTVGFYPTMLHSMMVYLWAHSILTIIEKWCRNFILVSKSVTVPWNTVC